MRRVFVRMLVCVMLIAMIVPLGAFAQKKMTITLWTKESEAEGVLQEIIELTKEFGKTHSRS